jgi:N-acylglucosamine 2-epimerase
MIEPNKNFLLCYQEELSRCIKLCEEDLFENILPFWESHGLDRVDGGYLNCFDKDGNLYDTRKPGWFIGRNLYMYSRLYNEFGHDEKWLEFADSGYQFLLKAYVGDGRFNYLLGKKGEVLIGPTSIYTDHFAIDGLFEYYKARKETLADDMLEKIRGLTNALFTRVQDPYFLHESEKIPWGMMKHSINFITLLIAMNSRELFGSCYNEILDSYVNRTLYNFASDQYESLFEYISEDGMPRTEGEGRIIDTGHAMESLWFSIKDGVVRNKVQQVERAGKILDWIIAHCLDTKYGGFFQHVDFETGLPKENYRLTSYDQVSVTWDAKIWWVQAESLVALAYSGLYNGNERHWSCFLNLLSYTREYFLDSEVGEWYSFLHRNNTWLDPSKGSLLKGVYHVPRCLVELIQLFKKGLSIIDDKKV